jgi:hypothetical protein
VNVSGRDTTAILATAIPGFQDMEAPHPVTGVTMMLSSIIMELNDRHRWSREAIADWLDTLPLNLEIQPFDEIKNPNQCDCPQCKGVEPPWMQLTPPNIEWDEPITLKPAPKLPDSVKWTVAKPAFPEWAKEQKPTFEVELEFCQPVVQIETAITPELMGLLAKNVPPDLLEQFEQKLKSGEYVQSTGPFGTTYEFKFDPPKEEKGKKK